MNQQPQDLPRNRAIVIGGGMAGLLAARVLADHYKEVTILERDDLPSVPQQRRGVPQGRHAHGILASGRRALEALFPGISRQLLGQGALTIDIARDALWFLEGGCLSRCESGLEALLMSRPLLEAAVRSRVRQLPNLQLRQECTADELAMTADRSRVVGVKAGAHFLPADLVVEAAGRGSRSPQWLEAFGYRRPVEERIEIGLGYTTRWFRRWSRHLKGDLAAVVPPTPSGKRGGVMLAQEADRWIVTLVGHFGHHAPAQLEGFIEYARTLPASFIYKVVRDAEPLGDADTARFAASVWRRYEKLDRFPDGYLVFGDAISSFNPRYGQGMSVAALQALELRGVLAERCFNLAGQFFTRAAKVVEIPWTLAASNDLRMPEVRGRRSLGSSLINWYMARLHRAAQRDPTLTLAFHKVANLLAEPRSVMAPAVALRVLRSNLPWLDLMAGRGLQGSQACQ